MPSESTIRTPSSRCCSGKTFAALARSGEPPVNWSTSS
jgi:hypothetical protein